MFAAVSVTIFAGALSERTKIGPLLIAGCVSAGIIYPVFGHWVWGSMITGSQSWLQNLGFMDFAGASVVHMTAGFIALAGLIVVGPRTRTNTGKSNIPLAVLGGLVAVTAVSAYCSPPAAMLLGLIAGVLSDLASSLLIKAGIDDIVNVVPVHLIGGITGCVLLPFMIDSSYIQAGGRSGQFGVQLTGVAVNFLWAFGMAYLLFRVIDRIMGLRVTAEEEKKGLNLNIVEFSDIYSWQNYIEISAYESEINDKNRLLRKQARLLAVTEEQEKNKLAKDLHDGVGQSLSALKMILGMGKNRPKKADIQDWHRRLRKHQHLQIFQ